MSAMRRGEVGVLLSATSLSKAYKELLPSNRQFKKKKKLGLRFVGTLHLLMQGVFHIVFCRHL